MKKNRNTKIICTLGPASSTSAVISKMIDNGMDIARINMSHGTHQSLQNIINTIFEYRQKNGLKLLIDTKGPEIRIGTFINNEVVLQKNQIFSFTTRDIVGDENMVSLKYKELINQVQIGSYIMANNGQLRLKVVDKNNTDIICKVLFGGKLSNNKGLNVPNVVPSTPYLSEIDRQDILFGIKNKMDYLALSFVSNAQNVIDIKNFLKENNYENVKIFAKIENVDGVKNAQSILNECDGLLVARGDLGVEIALEKLPVIQKKLISLCNVSQKFAIVATEMLESMVVSSRPTRAEVNDVANAIYDEANATMLSAETSVGHNPPLAVKTMQKIINEVEKVVYDTKSI